MNRPSLALISGSRHSRFVVALFAMVPLALWVVAGIVGMAHAQAAGTITTFAGGGTSTADGVPATQELITGGPGVLAFDIQRDVFFSEGLKVRRVDARTGLVTTIAGNGAYSCVFGCTSVGDGGPATSATFSGISALAADPNGNVYVADMYNNRIRKVDAVTGIITTVAGNGNTCIFYCNTSLGDGGPALDAQLQWPAGLGIDQAGDIYISDTYHARVRKVDPVTGIITTVAGRAGSTAYSVFLIGHYPSSGNGGPATGAVLGLPSGLSLDKKGNLYFADLSVVRRVDASTGIISTVAGVYGPYTTWGFSGDGGPATSAELYSPQDVKVDAAGNLFIADFNNFRIREVRASTGIITTVAGNGSSYCSSETSGDGQPATTVPVGAARSIGLDSVGNLYISDYCDGRVREVWDVAAGAPLFVAAVVTPGSLAFASQAENTTSSSQPISIQNTGTIPLQISGTSITGTDASAFAVSNTCTTVQPNTSCVISVTFTPDTVGTLTATLSISDNASGSPQTVNLSGTGTAPTSPSIVTVIAGDANGSYGFSGDGGPATSARLNGPTALAFDAAGNLYVADETNGLIRRIDAVTGVITTVAGNASGCAGYDQGDGQPATSIALCGPSGVALDSAGNLYIAEQLDIRKVSAATGIITTVAGTGVGGFSGDGGPATSAELNAADGVAVDSSGNVYIADGTNGRVRVVSAATGNISTIAGSGFCGTYGAGPILCNPAAVALDSSGTIYVADAGYNNFNVNGRGDYLLKISPPSQTIGIVAGDGIFGYSGDGLSGTAAELNDPRGVAIDTQGDVFIADTINNRIRMVQATTGTITTVAGNGSKGTAGVGGSATSMQLNLPYGVAVDGAGNLYIADTQNNRILKVSGVAP